MNSVYTGSSLYPFCFDLACDDWRHDCAVCTRCARRIYGCKASRHTKCMACMASCRNFLCLRRAFGRCSIAARHPEKISQPGAAACVGRLCGWRNRFAVCGYGLCILLCDAAFQCGCFGGSVCPASFYDRVARIRFHCIVSGLSGILSARNLACIRCLRRHFRIAQHFSVCHSQ